MSRINTRGRRSGHSLFARLWNRKVAALLKAAVVVTCAMPSQGGVRTTIPDATAMPDSHVAAPVPAGFVSFCLRYPNQCAASATPDTRVTLTADTWRTLLQVNASVNDAIWPQDDAEHFGRAEYWTLATDGYGNCHAYALSKRKALIDAGLPAAALRIALVITPRGGRHAVLTVSTDHGDFVLDNLRTGIVAWNETGYRWIERQNPDQPMGWVSLRAAGDGD